MSRAPEPDFESQETYQDIHRMIEDGSYFRDALDWYAFTYLAPIWQRSIAFFVCLFMLIAAIPVIISFDHLYPLSTRIPFVVWAKYSEDQYPTLKKLAENMDNSEEMLIQYFIVNYIKDRETYLPGNRADMRYREARVREASSRRVDREYNRFTSPKNPDSPFAVYGKNSRRVISNIRVTFPKGQKKLALARATFDAYVSNVRNKQVINVTKWEAEISFRFTDLRLVLDEKRELQLNVQRYQVKQIK